MDGVFDSMSWLLDLESWLGDGWKFVEEFEVRAIIVADEIHRIGLEASC